MYLFLELLGTAAFAISGAMVGVEKKMDILGVMILGMTTAVGGGIIRDVIIGVVPPAAFQNPVYAFVAIGVSLIVFVPAIRNRINVRSPLINVVDAIGLGVFTVTGVRVGMAFNNMFLVVFLGVITGVGGGVVRDIFAARTPVIFVQHFYAVASMAGAIACAIIYPYSHSASTIATVALIIILRVLAARYDWNLPKVN